MTALALVPAFPETVSLPLTTEQARIEEYVRQSRAKSTLRGYRSDFREFEAWCNDRGTPAMPASQEAVCGYLAACADRGLKAGSIQRRLSAIAAAHTAHELESPTTEAAVRLCMAGIRRRWACTRRANPHFLPRILPACSSICLIICSAFATGRYCSWASLVPSGAPNSWGWTFSTWNSLPKA